MIIVTEKKQIANLGDVLKDIEYPKYDDYRITNDYLYIWIAGPEPECVPVQITIYVPDSWTKVKVIK